MYDLDDQDATAAPAPSIDDRESAGHGAFAYGNDQHNETLVRSTLSTRSGLGRSTKAVVADVAASAGVLAWSSPVLAHGPVQHNETLVRSPARRR
jgi:hypothetical protein